MGNTAATATKSEDTKDGDEGHNNEEDNGGVGQMPLVENAPTTPSGGSKRSSFFRRKKNDQPKQDNNKKTEQPKQEANKKTEQPKQDATDNAEGKVHLYFLSVLVAFINGTIRGVVHN